MMRRVLCGWLLMLGIACGPTNVPATAPPQVVAPVPPPVSDQPSAAPAVSSAPPKAAPEFQVVAEGWHGGLEFGTQLRLCPIDGAVFLCGSPKLAILREQGFEREAALEAGLPGDRLIWNIAGKWPESAWLLYADPDSGNWSFAVYHWTKSRWDRVLDVPRGHVSLSVQLAGWKEGAIAYIDDRNAATNKATSRQVLLGTKGPGPDFPPPLATPTTCPAQPGSIVLTSLLSGDLAGLNTTCDGKRALVARWSGGAQKPTTVDLPPCPEGGPAIPSKVAAVEKGLAVIGSCGIYSPYVALVEGSTTSLVDLSGQKGMSRGYTRNASGEYLVLGNAPRSIVVRRKDKTWEPLELWSRFARLSCPEHGEVEPPAEQHPQQVHPRDVWTLNGETWISGVTTRSDCKPGSAGVLLRSTPVARVIHLP